MTNTQKRIVENLTKEAKKKFLYNDEYEVKEYRVDENKLNEFGTVILYMQIGIKEDEGTWAMLCRKTIHLFIGPRGAIHYYENKTLKNGKFKVIRRRYTGSLWDVVIANKYAQ